MASLPLSDVKSRLSEVVRKVRTTGEPVVITVDGAAAAQLGPVVGVARALTPAEVAVDQAMHRALQRLLADEPPFDAVELCGRAGGDVPGLFHAEVVAALARRGTHPDVPSTIEARSGPA